MDNVIAKIGPLPEIELIISTSQLQSSKFLNLCRICQSKSAEKSTLVLSLFDNIVSWESGANRIGFSSFLSNVKFIQGGDVLSKLDWSDSDRVLDHLFLQIEKLGDDSDTIILDGLDIICVLLEDLKTVRNSLMIFANKICSLSDKKHVTISMRPRSNSSLDEFFVRCFAHSVNQITTLDQLSTGLASDVTGKMTIYHPLVGQKSQSLYKTSEKSVSFIERGLLSTSGRNDFGNLN